jgi:drug/metabolite transporter (DMT)-like permease
VSAAPAPASPPARARPVGLIALCLAVLFFSLGSTIVKKAGLPGPTLAFWRMLVTAGIWSLVLAVTERDRLHLADLRTALVPGVVFGLNITLFFTGVTKTSVANAEFIGALTPIVLIPIGALLFKEKVDLRALSFGVISFVGLAIVLFNAPPRGAASWTGNIIMVGAMFTWATYLTTMRRIKNAMSLPRTMAALMLIASITILPITAARGELSAITVDSLPYIAILAVMTGTGAHGLMLLAQRSVPIGTIGTMQVAQPALAVCWAYLFLDQGITGIQVVGMALVLFGLAAVVLTTRRNAAVAARTLVDAPLPVER